MRDSVRAHSLLGALQSAPTFATPACADACSLRCITAQTRTHKDAQHQTSGILYVASGLLGLALARQRVVTGVHMLLPAIGQAISECRNDE